MATVVVSFMKCASNTIDISLHISYHSVIYIFI